MTAVTPTVTSRATADDIVIQVDTIDQLFNAPELNPFSKKSIDVLGESALTRITRLLLARSVRKSDNARMVIQMPPDQMTPGLQARTTEAIHRYADAKIEDNLLSVRLSRRIGLIELLIACGLAVAALALTSFLLAGPLANLSDELRGFIIGFVSIFAWVLLWNPLDKLLFGWVEPRAQNAILHKFRAMEVVIEPHPGPKDVEALSSSAQADLTIRREQSG